MKVQCGLCKRTVFSFYKFSDGRIRCWVCAKNWRILMFMLFVCVIMVVFVRGCGL